MVPCTSQAQLSLFAARALVFGLFPEPWSPRRIPLLPRLHPDAIWPTALPRQETEKKKSPPGARLDVLSEQDTREASTATRGRHAARGVSREESRIAGNPRQSCPDASTHPSLCFKTLLVQDWKMDAVSWFVCNPPLVIMIIMIAIISTIARCAKMAQLMSGAVFAFLPGPLDPARPWGSYAGNKTSCSTSVGSMQL